MENKKIYTTVMGTNYLGVSSLSLCNDYNRVVVAGRSLLKIFSFNEKNKTFVEQLNLQGGRRDQGMNMSSAAVSWNKQDSSLIATGATNGAVLAWDLNIAGRNKQLSVFNEHSRSINTICFHPLQSNLLLSGSAEPNIKMVDVRKKLCSSVFETKSDGVRDIRCSPHDSTKFAVGTECGLMQLWDMRNPSKFLNSIIAHKGPIFCMDWHPDPTRSTIVTGGRDKTLKVWNVSHGSSERLFEIRSMYPCGHVKWRPGHPNQMAESSFNLGFNIRIWDVQRCHVPYAEFDLSSLWKPSNTTGMGWSQSDSCILYSVSKNGLLALNHISEADFGVDQFKASGLAINNRGWVVSAGQNLRTENELEKNASFKGLNESYGISSPHQQTSKMYQLFSKSNLQGSKSSDDELSIMSSSPSTFNQLYQQSLSKHSSMPAHWVRRLGKDSKDNQVRFASWNSNLLIHQVNNKLNKCFENMDECLDVESVIKNQLTLNGFDIMAQNYLLDGPELKLTFEDACKRNSSVAMEAGEVLVARTWLLLTELYGDDLSVQSGNERESVSKQGSTVVLGPLSRTTSDAAYIERAKRGSGDKESKRSSLVSQNLNKDDIVPISALGSCNNIIEGEDWDQFINGEFPDFMSGDSKNTLLKDLSASLDDIYPTQASFTKSYSTLENIENLDDTNNFSVIPTEAFETRQEIGDDAMTKSMNYEFRALANSTDDIKDEVLIKEMQCSSDGTSEVIKSCHVTEADGSSDESVTSQLSDQSFDEGEWVIHDVAKDEHNKSDFDVIMNLRDEVICEQLKWLVDKGHVQSVVSMMLLIQSYSTGSPKFAISTKTQEHWQTCYINSLFLRKFYVQRAQVIKMSQIESVNTLSHASTTQVVYKHSVVANGLYTIKSFKKEKKRFVLCQVCSLPMRTSMLFCISCGLSGHQECINKWRKYVQMEGATDDCCNHRLS